MKTLEQVFGNLVVGPCRYCESEIPVDSAAITFAYWNATPFLCHPKCKESGEKQEAFDCQNIDCDCNDCRYFQRIRMASKQYEYTRTTTGELVELTFQPQISHGHCFKFNRPTEASPKKWSGLECFKHRRSIEPPSPRPEVTRSVH